MRSSYALALALLVAAPAFAQDAGADLDAGADVDAGSAADAGSATDAGSPVDAGSGCGTLTFEGECVGTLLRYCDEGAIVEEECADTSAPNGGAALTCVEISADFGFACAALTGEECVSDEALYFCTGTQAGCVDNGVTGVCTENLGAFTETDIGTCDGEDLIVDVIETQPYILECAEVGGTCDAAASICVGADLDMPCFADFIDCDDGLECTDNICTTAPAEGEGEGEGETDGGPTGAEPDSGCGCDATAPSSSGTTAGLSLVLVLGGLALRRRRR